MRGPKPPSSAIATAIWVECTRCGHWWLVPRSREKFVDHFIGPCCRVDPLERHVRRPRSR